MKTINYLKSHFYNTKNGSVILLLLLFVVLGISPGAVQAQTVVTLPTTTTNNSTGSVNSSGTKSNGDMVNLSSSTGNSPRGWAHFDLTSIPAGSLVTAVRVNFTTFSSSGTQNNNIYGFTGDPNALSGTNLYNACDAGNSFNNTNWAINQANTEVFDADGISFIQANIGTNNANIGFVRGGSSLFNIRGYLTTPTSLRPTLEVTYTPPCSGTPSPGNTVSSANPVCPSANFTLSLSTTPTLPGIAFQWQSANNAAFSSGVTNLGTASTQVTNQTAAKFYRCRVTCTSPGGSSSFSSVLQVTMNGMFACYCVPTYSEVEPITRVQFSNILNNSCAPVDCGPELENFTAIVGNVTKGVTYQMTVKGNTDQILFSTTRYITAFFDWNQNGLLSDAGESVDIGTITNSTGLDAIQAVMNITIPVGAVSGATLMRVSKRNNNYPDECNSGGSGQSEDYTLIISDPVVCSGTPAPGNTISTANPACSAQAFTLSLQNSFATFPDITYQWQSSLTGTAGSFANIGGATSPTYTTSITTATYFRCRVNCPTGSAGFSSVLHVTLAPCYCIPPLELGCNSGTGGTAISNFTFSGINNSSGCSASGYTNYSSSVACAQVTQGTTVPFSLSVANSQSSAQNVYAWIDFNDNGLFTDAGEAVYTGTVPANATSVTGNISIPTCVPTGPHRMRVRMELLEITDPCAEVGVSLVIIIFEFGGGEAEDYCVNVNPAPFVPALASNLSGPSSTTCNTTVNYTLAPGFSGGISWQYSTVSSGGPFNSVPGGITTPTLPVDFLPLGPGDYHVRAKFTGLGCTPEVFSNVVSTTVTSPVVSLSASPSLNVCRGEQVTLTASGGGPYTWNNGGTTSSISVNPIINTTYNLVTGSGICQGAGNITVNVIGGPVAAAGLGDPGLECPNSNKQLQANQINSAGGPVTFTGGSVTIVDNAPGNPYPSNLIVTGLVGTPTITNVKINGFSHTFPSDVDIALVAPNGSKVLLMADNGAGNVVNNANLTFQDGSSNLPNTLVTGTYRTTTNTTWNGTLISSPFGSLLSSLGGSFNGTWKLYVYDDANTDFGSITSWSITFNSPLVPFTYNGPVTYSWSDGSSIVSTVPNPVFTPDVATTYTLTVADNSCSSSSSVLVNMLPKPSVSYTTDLSNFYCETQTINFSATGSGVNNGGPAVAGSLTVTVSGVANLDETSWQIRNNANVVIASGGGNNVYAFGSTNVHTVNPPLSAYPVTFIIETNGSFGDNVADYNIDCSVGNYSLLSGSVGDFDGPGQTFTSPILSCIQGGGVGLDYVWNGPNGFYSIAEDPSLFGSQIAHTGDYTVTVIDANGCNDSQTQYIEVNPNPVTNITTTQVSCPGLNDAIATFDITTQPSYNDYSIIEGSNTGNFNPQVFTGYSDGSYFYQVTELNTGCTSFGSFNVTTVPNVAPAITLAASNTIVECDGSGNIAELNAWLSSNGGATAFDACGSLTWQNNYSALTTSCASTGSATVTFTVTDEQNVSTSTSATFTIVDTTAPVISVQASNSTVECDGAGNMAAFNNWIASRGGASASDACSGVTWTNDFLVFPNNCSATGAVTVNFTATDICGNASVTTASFTIVDTTPPAITAASNSTVECNGLGNNNALNAWLSSHGGSNASDLCSGSVTWTDNYSGLSNPCGATGSATVTFTATDGCGNATSTTASFTIVDTSAPTITAAANETVQCDGNGNTAALNAWITSNGGATASDVCSNVTWSNDYSALSSMCSSTGSATVTFTATDNCGNAASSSATFTIIDDLPPVLVTPADIVLNNDVNQCGAVVNFAATANDMCSGNASINYSKAPGSFFDIGTTQVNIIATDNCGNATNSSFNVTIIDNQIPVISCQGNINVSNSPGICGALVNYTAVVASDNCNYNLAQTNGNASGDLFPIGVTVNTYEVADASGNTATCSFSVTVNDTQAPYLASGSDCPANITSCNPVSWAAPNYIDNCPGVQVTSSHVSGSDFPIGTTLVTYTATDVVGLVSTCTFSVTVLDTSLAADSIVTNRDYNNICLGGNITLTIQGGHLGEVAPGVDAEWRWYRNGCGVLGGGVLIGTGTSITVAPTSTTTYYARAFGGCYNTDCVSKTVIVNSGPPTGTPVYTVVPPQGAPGVTGVLSVAPVPGATFYQWFTNGGHINSVLFNGNLSPEYTSGPSVNVSFVIPEQNYQIRVIAGNACGRTNQSNTHIRGTVAAPTSMTGPTQVCPGAPVTYTIPPIPPVSGNSPVTYSWALVPSTAGTITVSPNGLTATVNFAVGFGSAQVCANGISSFGLPGTPYCTSVSSSAPIPGAISGNSVPCSGNPVPEIYSILPVSGAVTYGWSSTVPGAIVVPAPGGLSAAVSFPAGSFTGSVRVTASSACGTSAPSVFNVTNGIPGNPGNINGAPGGLCNVQDVSFNLSTTNALSYIWSVTSNMSIDGPGTNNSVIVDFLPGFTTGIVTVQANYACGSVIKTHAVSGAPSPAVIVDADVCPNTAQTYFLTNIEPSTVYSWTTSGDILDEYCTFGNCTQYFIEVGGGGGAFTIVASNSCGIAAPVFSGSNCRVAGGGWTDAKVYPNPSTGVINIDFSSAQDGMFKATISDLSGRTIMANDLQATIGHNHDVLDLSSLNAGIYLLQLKDPGTGNTSIFRLVIE